MSTSKLKISCASPPCKAIADYGRLAEQLGYEGFWVADSPALYGDLWIAVARVAEATERIGLGTAVAVPNLRHPMVTASAIATVEELAPGRLVVAFGAGMTARKAMGHKALKWDFVKEYIRQVRGLLAGEVVTIEDRPAQMIHSPGFAPARPIHTPLLAAPMGPKGFAAAREVGDGAVFAAVPQDDSARDFERAPVMVSGTVLDPGEDHTTPRVQEAAGPWFTTGYHAIWEFAPPALQGMPGGAEWLARVEASRPEAERHLSVHEGHVVAVTDQDRPILAAAGPALTEAGWTGSEAEVRERLEQAEAAGITEVVYFAAGPDMPREFEAFARAAKR